MIPSGAQENVMMHVTNKDVTKAVLEWSAGFVQLSLRDFNHFTHEAGLSMGQMMVLTYLHYHNACEVSGFCDLMHITKAGASQMVGRLAKMGLVQRVNGSADRRVRLVELTDEGRRVVAESIGARQTWVDELAAQLSATEREEVCASLRVLNEHVARLNSRQAEADGG